MAADRLNDEPDERSFTLRESEVRGVLKDCCRHEVQALLVFHDAQLFVLGKFSCVLGDEQFVIVAQHPVPNEGLSSPAMCTVTFHHRSRLSVFLSRLHEIVPPRTKRTGARMVLGLPIQISGQDARLAERVPVSKDDPLDVAVVVDGVRYPARGLNVSMCGVLVYLPERPLPLNQEVRVYLRLDGASIDLAGIVRRQVGPGQVGIFFPETVRGEMIDPPAGLRRIVLELGRGGGFGPR